MLLGRPNGGDKMGGACSTHMRDALKILVG